MTICFFGNYIRDYPRVRVLMRGLRENGVEVLECHTRKRGLGKYWDLFRQHWKLRHGYDVLLVGMGGQTLVWFARVLSRRPVFFDAFTSLYLTNVEDRRTCSPQSWRAGYYAALDRWSCQLADKVLLDTNAQIAYFVKNFGADPGKFIRVFTGADPAVFYPMPGRAATNGRFLIHWHGYIVPFYGLETVIEAARILKDHADIKFRIVTRFNGKYERIKNFAESFRLSNVEFVPESTVEDLNRFINDADVCLGVFGDNPKARVVIPNKIIEAIACGKAVLTGRQEVLQELFTEGENIILINPLSPDNLAQTILALKNNESKRALIGQKARRLYEEKLLPATIVKRLIAELKKT